MVLKSTQIVEHKLTWSNSEPPADSVVEPLKLLRTNVCEKASKNSARLSFIFISFLVENVINLLFKRQGIERTQKASKASTHPIFFHGEKAMEKPINRDINFPFAVEMRGKWVRDRGRREGEKAESHLISYWWCSKRNENRLGGLQTVRQINWFRRGAWERLGERRHTKNICCFSVSRDGNKRNACWMVASFGRWSLVWVESF